MKTVTLYTDGACSGNPGPGGWGAILEYNGVEKELSGGEDSTTNNRMELTAVIRGLQALNVFFGGTLYAYIPGHQSPEGDILHATRAVGELAELVGTEPLVNSNHHQAVHRLGAGLSVRQWAGDGVIEGICHTALPILAVQWHPEFSFRVDAHSRKIFGAFVAAAGKE